MRSHLSTEVLVTTKQAHDQAVREQTARQIASGSRRFSPLAKRLLGVAA